MGQHRTTNSAGHFLMYQLPERLLRLIPINRIRAAPIQRRLSEFIRPAAPVVVGGGKRQPRSSSGTPGISGGEGEYRRRKRVARMKAREEA